MSKHALLHATEDENERLRGTGGADPRADPHKRLLKDCLDTGNFAMLSLDEATGSFA